MAHDTLTQDAGATQLELPAELTIYTVGEQHPHWLAWLSQLQPAPETESPVVVDAAAVDLIDAAGVQLLVSLQHGLKALGLGLALRQPSRTLHDGCAALGLSRWLADASTDEMTA